MKQMDEDIELVDRFRAGDEGAFDALIAKYQRRVYATAYRMTRDMEEAKDVTQKVFMNAFQGLGAFRKDSSFKTWLYQIAVNLCLNQVRQKKGQEVELDDTVAGNQKGALSVMIEHEERERLKQALSEVPERQRMALVLRVYEGFDIAETARAMGCSEGAVKAHYHHAVKKLREILKEAGHEHVA